MDVRPERWRAFRRDLDFGLGNFDLVALNLQGEASPPEAADAACRAIGHSPVRDAWAELTRDGAQAWLEAYLSEHMADATPRLSSGEARRHAATFVAMFEGASFLVSAGLPPGHSSYAPLSSHTFDAAIAAVLPGHVAMLCLHDDD